LNRFSEDLDFTVREKNGKGLRNLSVAIKNDLEVYGIDSEI